MGVPGLESATSQVLSPGVAPTTHPGPTACQRCGVTDCTLERAAVPPSAHGKRRSAPRPSSQGRLRHSRSALSLGPRGPLGTAEPGTPAQACTRFPERLSDRHGLPAPGRPGLAPHRPRVGNRATGRTAVSHGAPRRPWFQPRGGRARLAVVRASPSWNTRPGACPCPDDPQAFARELGRTAHQAPFRGTPEILEASALEGDALPTCTQENLTLLTGAHTPHFFGAHISLKIAAQFPEEQSVRQGPLQGTIQWPVDPKPFIICCHLGRTGEDKGRRTGAGPGLSTAIFLVRAKKPGGQPCRGCWGLCRGRAGGLPPQLVLAFSRPSSRHTQKASSQRPGQKRHPVPTRASNTTPLRLVLAPGHVAQGVRLLINVEPQHLPRPP